ncbi:hypothetical protein [Natrarchaeobius chitinivorans]|uniref:Uncharacterized protein n=1 Tax=Natrarchaeobius chitinivorans TaxID=1679083 RepID=A0A3N6M5G7_NATCH|nr:hypothetical protein [Natrarchaeobius chitinivorans]RQG97307.1 hypothetical protein EA473_04395 [Natrarchaeobius chitinivorans]
MEGLVNRLATLRERLEPGMDRREFLRTLATGGYAVGLAHFLGVEDFLAADDGEVPVVTALVREDPDDPSSLVERTRSVPAEWYAAVEKALELNELMARVAFTGYLGSAVVPGEYSSGAASVSVGISTEGQSIPEMIEEFAGEVSIDTERIIRVESIDDDPGFAEPRAVDDLSGGDAPSGFVCETPSSMATLAPALYHPEADGPFFVTAEHAFKGTSNPEGDLLRLPTESGETFDLGNVAHVHPVEDIVAAEPSGQVRPSSRIAGRSSVRVRGQYTRFGLADLIARGEELEKVGALTGHTVGQIQGIDAVTCFTDDFCRRGQIRWGGEMDLTDGDSGSVSFHPDPAGEEDDVLVAGFNNARTWWPGQSYVWGVSAYKLTDEYGYHF